MESAMNNEIRDQIALFRYKLISPILAEPARAQNAYLRQQADREHDIPHTGRRVIAISTFKGWLRSYLKLGLDGLRPKPRADRGRPRRLNDEQVHAIRVRCKAYPHLNIKILYETLLGDDLLGHPPMCYNSLVRIIHREKLLPTEARTDCRKRFEMDAVNQLWICDFMHGPTVRCDRRRAKAVLCAIIDDHSRMIVGHAFAANETVSALTIVLKDAFAAFGLPLRLYVDNGPAFVAELLVGACARAGISLIHSKPYDAPSRGKIERFFRTVRERFLVTLAGDISLDELNAGFTTWLQDDYHHKEHAGIDGKPIDRYHDSAAHVQIRRLAAKELDEIFLVRYERIVNNDATISFKSNIYEVPAAYIRQKIEIRHPVDDCQDLWLYDNGAKVGRLKLVNPGENATTFRPTPDISPISFAKQAVKP